MEDDAQPESLKLAMRSRKLCFIVTEDEADGQGGRSYITDIVHCCSPSSVICMLKPVPRGQFINETEINR